MGAKKKPSKPEDAVANGLSPQGSAGNRGRRRWLVIAVALAVMGLGLATTWAALELVIWNKLPAALIGKWVVVGGEQDGATFDFYRSGAMVARINLRGNEGIINAHVAVEGETLSITTRNPRNQEVATKKQTIRKLDGKELVFEDERGQRIRLERADD